MTFAAQLSSNKTAVCNQGCAQASISWDEAIAQTHLRRRCPIRISTANVVVVSMVTLALCILSIGWSGARQSLLAASRSAQDAGQLMTEKSRRMLEATQATLRPLTSISLVEASALAQRLQRVRTLSDVLVSRRRSAPCDPVQVAVRLNGRTLPVVQVSR